MTRAEPSRTPPKTAAGTWTDHLGYGLAAVVFLGIGLMRGMNEPAEEIPLAPGLHTVAAAHEGERVRLLVKIEAIDSSTVTLSDGPHSAVASISPEVGRRIVPGAHAHLACTVAEPGPKPRLDCAD